VTRVTVFAAGVVVGVLAAAGGLFALREYRRQHVSVNDDRAATLGVGSFTAVNGPDAGLGPGFNGASCATCHAIPDVGGWGTITTLRVARRNPDGTHHAYEDGPVVPMFSNPGHECQAVIPPDANIFARRLPISTFGSGLIDAIADDELIALEDPDDRNGDGVSGRAARVMDRASGTIRIGRFGWKAQQASLLAFAAQAYKHEMGITTELYPDEGVIGVDAAKVRQCDEVAEPEDPRQVETGLRSIDLLTAFMRSLPAPEPATADRDTTAGSRHFAAVGCTACHRPQVGQAHAFSDFLLHDIGTGDGIAEGDAAPHEMRTAALWGIRSRQMHLHDGSAGSIAEAIARHGGEAASARARYAALPEPEQRQLLAFVKSR